MVIDELTDLDALRALAKGMQTYQARLERRNKELAEENARLRGEVSPEQLELLAAKREEELTRLRKQVFGTSSERRTPPVQEAPKVKEPRRGHGPTPHAIDPSRGGEVARGLLGGFQGTVICDGPVLGRKNHYGSRSKHGTEVAAILYTMIETCRRCGVNPEHYLGEALRRALSAPGAALLPQELLRGPAG